MGHNAISIDDSAKESITAFAHAIADQQHLNIAIEPRVSEQEIREFGKPDDPFPLFEIVEARTQEVQSVIEDAGILSDRIRRRGAPPWDYEEFVAPYSARILAAVGVPTIHFGTGTAHLLAAMSAAGGDAIGLDWRVPLDQGWLAVGPDRAVQGNLDPAALLAPWARTESAAEDVLARAGGRPGHVFNLGHGVLPATDPADLSRLVELVHERTSKALL